MLKITGLSKSYFLKNTKQTVFADLNLQIVSGEFIIFFGPNGCGKTTLLNIIAGLNIPDSGSVIFDNDDKKVAYIFQNYRQSLFPWLTVRDNLAYPLKLLKVVKSDRYQAVARTCEEFDIKINLNSYPYTLSGGQQQLVAILRALITKPDVILMDEPFSSLDYQTGLFMVQKIQAIWLKTSATIIFVSHDIDEAVLLSQRLILFSNKPTRIVKDLRNPLVYPRSSEQMVSPDFGELKRQVLEGFVKQVNYSV